MNQNEKLLYWIKNSDRDYQAMIHLFEKKHYTWSLFIGHLVLEKLLKALYTQNFSVNPPFTPASYQTPIPGQDFIGGPDRGTRRDLTG